MIDCIPKPKKPHAIGTKKGPTNNRTRAGERVDDLNYHVVGPENVLLSI